MTAPFIDDDDIEGLETRADSRQLPNTNSTSHLNAQAALTVCEGTVVDPPGHPVPNARRFVDHGFSHQERPLLVHQGGVFYAWNGACWPLVDDADLRTQLYGHFEHALYPHEGKGGIVTMKPFAPTRYKVADLLDALRAVTHLPVNTTSPSWISGTGFAKADEIVSCDNGLVHIPTRTLHPHTPLYFTHHSIGFAFNPTAPEPSRWLAFLNELWPDDVESKGTLQEIFGYVISGDTRQQKAFLIVGPKRSGKGTTARILKSVMGAHNVAGPTLSSLGTDFGLSPLIGKPVAIISDARLKASDNSVVTERLLSISGEDVLTVDRKYKDAWTGQIGARIVILSNELPKLTDSSGALASRFIVLTMTNSFYGRENPNLTDELVTELPGIFNWALDGLERLRQRGRFVQPKASQDAIRDLEDLGSPVGAFIRDECVIGAEHTVTCDDMYQTWKSWCEGHGRRPSNTQVFGRDLRAAFPSIRVTQPRRDGARHRVYQGVGLARGGTRSSAMYSQQREQDLDADQRDGPENYIGGARVPSRANGNCQACDGEGCDWCEPKR